MQLHKSVKLEDVLALQVGTLEPVWAQMDTKSEGFMGGISFKGAVLYEGDKDRADMNASQLREVYIKNLKTLSENYELWNGLGISWGSSWAPGEVALRHINDALADAENTETFMTKNFYLYGSRDDIMKYIEDNKEEFCTIEDVRLSELVGEKNPPGFRIFCCFFSANQVYYEEKGMRKFGNSEFSTKKWTALFARFLL